MSSEATVAEPRLLVMSGTSGAGKTSIAARLLEDPRFIRAVTATTRPPRGDEQDGVHYHFHTRASFEDGLAQGAFLEHAEVYGGHLYGTPRAEVERILASGRHCVLVVDVQGAASIRRLDLSAVDVFVDAPSLEALAERLRRRGEDSEAAISQRLQAAAREQSARTAFQHVVVNHTVEGAAQEVAALLGLDLA